MAADLYVPASYASRKLAAEAEFFDVEKATVGVGGGFGSTVVLGPAGYAYQLSREKNSGGGRTADKSLYSYLYQRHPFVYACVEIICQTAAQDRHTYPQEDMPTDSIKPGVSRKAQKKQQRKQSALRRRNGELYVHQGEEDDGDEGDLGPEPKDGVEFLEHFFAEVNNFESFPDLLQAIYRDLLIYGEAFVLKQRQGASIQGGTVARGANQGETSTDADGGRIDHVNQNPTSPVECLHRIPSRDTFAVPGPDGYPAVYRQKRGDGGFREYAVADVIFIPLPDPDSFCKGLSPLEALDITMATDLSAAKYNEAYFRNGAKAGMVLAGQGLSEHEVRRNKAWLADEYTKPENAHKPMLLLGNLTLVRDGDKAQNDMEFLNLRKFTREEICAVYSVPISKLLHQSDGMGSTGKLADDITFRADTVGPLQTRVYEAFNRQLMKRDFPDYPLLIPPRQEKIRLDLLEAAKSMVAIGGTGNEARAVVHLPEIEHATMNIPLFLAPGVRALLTDRDAGEAAKLGLPVVSGATTDAQRPDRTSARTRSGQTNARAKGGTGMKTRKALDMDSALDTDEDSPTSLLEQ